MNNFSIPMVYIDDTFQKVLEINKSQNKSKIASCYGALTREASDAIGYENFRDHKSFHYYIDTIQELGKYVERIQNNGIIFQYCLNSGISPSADKLYADSNKIKEFCKKLLDNNITHLKISNLLLFDYIYNYFGDSFSYYLSTTKEYSSVLQYKRLFDIHPYIKELCLPSDLNKNFRFIDNLKIICDKIDIEIMVNEGCMYSCPWRKDHTVHSSTTSADIIYRKNTKIPSRMVYYYTDSCKECKNKDLVVDYFLRRIINPWEIETYNNHGIYKFKMAGRDMKLGYLMATIDFYLNGINDYNTIKNLPWNFFGNYNPSQVDNKSNVTIDQVRKYMIPISTFESRQSSCSDVCGVQCKKCIYAANKFKEDLLLKSEGE